MEATGETAAVPAAGPASADRPWPEGWPETWDGDHDKLWNREETARVLGIAAPTFDTLRRKGLPHRREGSHGKPYGFYMPEVWAWREGVEAEAEAAKRRKEDQVAQAQLKLVGGDASDHYRLKPQERKQLFDAEIARYKVCRERGELVEAEAFRHAIRQTFSTLAQFLQTMPEGLARELGWDMTATALCQDKVDQFQERLARLLMHDGGRDDGPLQ